MSSLRVELFSRVTKPLPSALVSAWPDIQAKIATVLTYARKTNEGQPNEENTNYSDVDNQTGYVDYTLLLAIPESATGTVILQNTDPDGNKSGGIRLPTALVTQLAAIRTAVRQLITYGEQTGDAKVRGRILICHHDDQDHLVPDETAMEI